MNVDGVMQRAGRRVERRGPDVGAGRLPLRGMRRPAAAENTRTGRSAAATGPEAVDQSAPGGAANGTVKWNVAPGPSA